MSHDIDIGNNHTMRFFGWSPDRDLNPQYEGIADIECAGVIIDHLTPQGVPCSGAVTFDSPQMRQLQPESNLWEVLSWEPLTIEPSVQCSCGDHGWIREGRWVTA